MDNKNTLVGTILLGVLIFGLFWYSNKTQPPAGAKKTTTAQSQSTDTSKSASANVIPMPQDSGAAAGANAKADSAALQSQLGPFAAASSGEDKDYTIENDVQKITISAKGGAIKIVQLKKYATWDKKPLFLFTEKSQQFSYQFVISGNRIVSTKGLYFEPTGESFVVKPGEEKSITFRLKAGDGAYFEQKYTLKGGDDYQLGYNVNVAGMEKVMPNSNDIQLSWSNTAPSQERVVANERKYSALYYK